MQHEIVGLGDVYKHGCAGFSGWDTAFDSGDTGLQNFLRARKGEIHNSLMPNIL